MDSALIFYSTFFILVVISAIFSASETAFTGVSRAKIQKLHSDGDKRAEIISNLKEQKESLLAVILIGNNTVNILASVLASVYVDNHYGENAVVLSTIIITIVIIVFAELLPKSYAISNSEKVALHLAKFLVLIIKILGPLALVINLLVDFFSKIIGIKHDSHDTLVSATEELRGAIDFLHIRGSVAKDDKDMLDSVLDLQETKVGEIMMHRKNMISIDIKLPNGEIIDQVLKSGHSRIPLWKDEPENIIAILNIKDLLQAMRLHNCKIDEFNILEISTDPWFIPETTSLREQLSEFRSRRNHIAIVVDEYGAIQGLVTLYDILEEIVGRIEDERVKSKDTININEDGSVIVNGIVTVRDVNRILGWDLPDEEAATIAGLIMHESETIPVDGEIFEFHNVRFTILSRENNEILLVKLEKIIYSN